MVVAVVVATAVDLVTTAVAVVVVVAAAVTTVVVTKGTQSIATNSKVLYRTCKECIILCLEMY